MDDRVREILDRPYTIEVVEEPGVGFFARVLELPGCMTQGGTEEEVRSLI